MPASTTPGWKQPPGIGEDKARHGLDAVSAVRSSGKMRLYVFGDLLEGGFYASDVAAEVLLVEDRRRLWTTD